uniref:Uncharacterized protein n=1 Tax=Octopus bimaculoides TaxID=37653 RepID=A0A0L8HEC4_OCTBM
MAMIRAPKKSPSLDSVSLETMTPSSSSSSKVRVSLGERVTRRFRKIFLLCSKKRNSVAVDPNYTNAESNGIASELTSHKGNIVPRRCRCVSCRFKPHKRVKFAPELETVLNLDEGDNECIANRL